MLRAETQFNHHKSLRAVNMQANASSHHRLFGGVPPLGGGTQDIDFNKGLTKGKRKTYSAKKWGVPGEPRPPYDLHTKNRLSF